MKFLKNPVVLGTAVTLATVAVTMFVVMKVVKGRQVWAAIDDTTVEEDEK